MSLWKNLANLALRRVDDAECPDCPPGLPGEDPAFSTAVTALGAKLAKADGRPDAQEFGAFSRVFQAQGASEINIRRLFNLASQTTLGFESYARRLAKRYRNCPEILEDVMDGLFHIAAADGAVTADEVDYLEQVAGFMEVPVLTFRRLKATHLGIGADDPYGVLSVPHDASDAEVREAWKALIAESHPDMAAARGLPPDFAEVAQIKAAAINAAYDAVMRERRAFAEAGAA
jgi:DnaJ like chaperone protein